MIDDPIFTACLEAFPSRPEIDPATTIYTREELDELTDYYMELIGRAFDWMKE